MSVRVFIEQLGSIGPHRMLKLVNEGTVSDFFILIGPDEGRPAAAANRIAWFDTDEISPMFVRRWAWWVATEDQAADVQRITELDALLGPVGWVLNVEGEWTKGADLSVLVSGVKALGRPIIASLAGQSASHVEYDYRTLDRAGVQVDWQAYFDSGEGPTPAVAVEELYRSSFVIPGWEYRSRLGTTYGWGMVTRCVNYAGYYDSYRSPGPSSRGFRVQPREWGWAVTARSLWSTWSTTAGTTSTVEADGVLLGRAAYSKIAITLDLTRGAQEAHSLAEWEAIAASARVAGARKRPVSAYLGEIASDEVLRAVAKGAA